MNRCKLALTAALAFAATGTAWPALAESGLYLGGGIGSATMEDDTGNPGGVDFDESDAAWKGFVGYNLDLLPLIKFAAEVGYRDLGQPDRSLAGIPVEYSAKGLDYGVLAGVGLGPVDLFARLGGFQYDLDKTVGGVTREFDGTAPVYGIGAWFTIAKIGVRAEYEKIDIDELDDAHMLSVSAFFKF